MDYSAKPAPVDYDKAVASMPVETPSAVSALRSLQDATSEYAAAAEIYNSARSRWTLARDHFHAALAQVTSMTEKDSL